MVSQTKRPKAKTHPNSTRLLYFTSKSNSVICRAYSVNKQSAELKYYIIPYNIRQIADEDWSTAQYFLVNLYIYIYIYIRFCRTLLVQQYQDDSTVEFTSAAASYSFLFSALIFGAVVELATNGLLKPAGARTAGATISLLFYEFCLISLGSSLPCEFSRKYVSYVNHVSMLYCH